MASPRGFLDTEEVTCSIHVPPTILSPSFTPRLFCFRRPIALLARRYRRPNNGSRITTRSTSFWRRMRKERNSKSARRCLLASFRSHETRCRAYLAAPDTTIRPRIYGWKLQKYEYVPGRVKRCIQVTPESMGPESNALFVPVTV
jgi:hypothetical protein